MSQNLVANSSKQGGVAKRPRAIPFSYELSSTDGLVIHQVADKVSKRDWADLELFIRFCQAGARGRLTVTVELRPRIS